MQHPPVLPPARARLHWLWVAVAALAVAGLYAIPVAGIRSTDAGEVSALQWFFHRALVPHVDLSVLVWFLAMMCVLLERARPNSGWHLPYASATARWLMGFGIAGMAASALIPSGEALMVNYIPVITNPLFFLSLSAIAAALVLVVADAGIALLLRCTSGCPAMAGAGGLVFCLLCAGGAFITSSMQLPKPTHGNAEGYYEQLFWAGGHILQYAYTQAAMLAWAAVAHYAGIRLPSRRILWLLMTAYPLIALYSLITGAMLPADSLEHRIHFTQLMIHLGGLPAGITLLWYLWASIRQLEAWRNAPAFMLGLCASWLVFMSGGFIGMMIQGVNVTIPAHYHGSVIGVSMALMLLAYRELHAHGGADLRKAKLVLWQMSVLCIGQLIHISALAISGGYGVLRKAPGGLDDPMVKMWMGIMGMGGGLAIVGGVLFVVIIALKRPKTSD